MSVREMDLTPAEYQLTAEKMDKLNARAAKRGWTGHIAVTGEEFTEKKQLANGLIRKRQLVHVTISGSPAKYDGWTFLARADWADGGMVLFTAPGVENIDRTGITEGACDHCKINRQRNSTFIVRHDDGRQLQVGSTCLKDFLGWDTNPVFIYPPSDDELFEGGYGHFDPIYDVETVLAASWACIQEFGYVRSGDYSGNSTKYTVLSVLDPRTPDERKLAEKIRPHIPESANAARMIREFILSDEFSGGSEYVTNLKNIARGEFVQPRFVGFLVSAPQAWAKAKERTLIQQRERSEIDNTFNGPIGDKKELNVKLISMRFVDGPYGVSTLYTFKGDDNRIYKWFSSREVLTEDDVDKDITIKGTVKKLEEYQGKISTMLTRCKVL